MNSDEIPAEMVFVLQCISSWGEVYSLSAINLEGKHPLLASLRQNFLESGQYLCKDIIQLWHMEAWNQIFEKGFLSHENICGLDSITVLHNISNG